MNHSPLKIDWSITTHGDSTKPALLLLHGFAGTHRYWDRFLPELQKYFHVITPDLPGHGQSIIHDTTVIGWDDLIHDFMDTLKAYSNTPMMLVGYSMGARFAMHLLTQFPAMFTRAIFVSGSTGIENTTERELRWAQDVELSNRITTNGMEWFAEFWGRLPLFRNRRRLPESEQKILHDEWLSQNPKQLSAGLLLLSVGRQEYLLDLLKRITIPVKFIAGSEDEKYASLFSEYRAVLPTATFVLFPDCGHDVPREMQEKFIEETLEFFVEKGKQ